MIINNVTIIIIIIVVVVVVVAIISVCIFIFWLNRVATLSILIYMFQEGAFCTFLSCISNERCFFIIGNFVFRYCIY